VNSGDAVKALTTKDIAFQMEVGPAIETDEVICFRPDSFEPVPDVLHGGLAQASLIQLPVHYQ
jgi:hypothetical protein